MIRILLWNLALFFVPFILTALWLIWVKRRHPAEAQKQVWAWAALAGVVLVLGSFGVWRSLSGDDIQGQYISPTLKDGKVIEGHFE
ncbi:MAG: hypothetical protein HAW65_00505 [Alphaproteobacteria bacterium]|nr:hypothetical protein [Alphaproteobacteria bacterium]MBE8219775.1 hypothetical protein [Alphaproteobacteria bacterium]